jgi:hypothetical protein
MSMSDRLNYEFNSKTIVVIILNIITCVCQLTEMLSDAHNHGSLIYPIIK